MPLNIEYESEGFPENSGVQNGPATLLTTMDEVLWAAMTIGRPNTHYVLRHGAASLFEAIFRISLVRMSLEQRIPSAIRLRRTEAFKNLDPSEKAAINYFLGLIFGKLFAAKCLGCPWLLHLDVFRQQLGLVTRGRSRPDLIGDDGNGRYIALECKGRISQPNSTVKQKAKEQAQRVIQIQGSTPTYCVGSISYFKNDTLNFYWRDPDPKKSKNSFFVNIPPSAWRYYYAPVISLFDQDSSSRDLPHKEYVDVGLPAADIRVSINSEILEFLRAGKWKEARELAHRIYKDVKDQGYQPDGIKVTAGETWMKPFTPE